MSNISTYAVEAHDLVKVFRGATCARSTASRCTSRRARSWGCSAQRAGKTTAVRILSTILNPDSGHASILGHDVVKEAQTVRRIIGLAGQYAAVDENLTGRENIRMVGRLSHMSWKASGERATELLENFGLSDAGDRVLKTYSGGMRRRLDLAAALVARPRCSSSTSRPRVSTPRAAKTSGGHREAGGRGTTVLLTTQYLEEADRLARTIVVVDHGRVIAEGTRPS